jgi:hypothetical protein
MRDESSVCALHISDAAAGNAWPYVAAVVAAAIGHENDLLSTSGAQFGRLQLLVEYSHTATWGQLRPYLECACA